MVKISRPVPESGEGWWVAYCHDQEIGVYGTVLEHHFEIGEWPYDPFPINAYVSCIFPDEASARGALLRWAGNVGPIHGRCDACYPTHGVRDMPI
jgi:hypothetical protein